MVSSLIPFGFVPVITFLVMDSIAGNRRALWAALAAEAGTLGYAWARAGAPDWLALAGFALLAALVAASLRAGDDFYFKIHGALVSIASAAILLTAWYAFDRALLLDLTVEQVGLDQLAALDPRLSEETVAEMLRLLSHQLPWWLLLHALFTVYAAINWGKWSWGMVRMPGFLLALILASGFTQGAVMEDLEAGAARVRAARDSAAAKPAAPARDTVQQPMPAQDTAQQPAPQDTVK